MKLHSFLEILSLFRVQDAHCVLVTILIYENTKIMLLFKRDLTQKSTFSFKIKDHFPSQLDN